MNFRWFIPLFVLASLSLVITAAGKKSSLSDTDIPDDYQEEGTVTPTTTPAKPTPSAPKAPPQNGNASNVIFIHKPMPSPSWGRVVQYHRELSQSPSEKSREILHEFLFQDDQGVVRTAIYHESPNGEGYWEVWVWDQ